MLCNDNKDVLEEFLKRTEKALGENSIEDQLHKLKKSIDKVSLKRKKLLDNYLKGIIEQDKHVAGYAHELGKSVVLVVNKWDAVTKDEKTMAKMEKNLREQFKYLDYARIAFVSALKKQRINTLFDLIVEAYMNAHKRVTTSVLNDVIVDAQAMNPTTTFEGGRLKIYYANQVAVQPPTFVLFVNDPKFMHFSYKRYLENCLRDRFGFEGTPIHIICRKRD